jgi:hypothetical protein
MLFIVNNPELVHTLPRTAEALNDWDGAILPGEEAFTALAADLQQAREEKTIGDIAKRLNYEIPGIRGDVMSTGREIEKVESGPWKEALIEIEPEAWRYRDERHQTGDQALHGLLLSCIGRPDARHPKRNRAGAGYAGDLR